MAKYVAKTTVWLQVDSDYPDGLGEAQAEVEWFINQIKNHYAKGPDGAEVTVARATDVEILAGDLLETAGISVDKLWYREEGKPSLELDNGVR